MYFLLQVHTDVVNRKTTITTFPDITFYGSINSSDSEEDMARGKRRVKGRKARSNRNVQIKSRSNKSKVRNCDKCHNAVANSINMYRFYRTGLTVCKNCWITIDPSNDKTRRSRQVQSNLAETKLCTVFLTDVLNQESYDKKKIHNVEKDKDDNMLCDSSQEEVKSENSLSVSLKTRNHIVNGKARRGRANKRTSRHFDMEKSKDDVERTPSKITRLNKERTNTNEIKSAPVLADAEQQPSTQLTRRQRCKKMIDDRSSDSVDAEQQLSTQLTKRQGRGCKRMIDNRSSDSESSLEKKIRRNKLNDRVNKTSRKKQKPNLEETTSNTRLNSSDETSNEDTMSLRRKARSVMSSSTGSIKKEEEEERSTRSSRTRSSSISSTEMTPTEFKSPKSLAQSEAKTEYACDKCNKKFNTKLSNAKHRLTHLKQAALKLEKLTVSNVKKKQEMEVDSQDDEISKEATSDRTISTEKHADDPSEEIPINIEDDTDDEEIFNLLTKENVKQKEKELSDENDTTSNVIDKPDIAKSESHAEEESANDESIETKESEQCEKSTVMSDDTVTLEIEDDKDTRDKYTEDKDETSANRDSDKSKDKDTQETVAVEKDHVEEQENKEVEHETKVSTEKEKTISECNSDKEDLDEETMQDSETTRSPILSIRNTIEDNKNHSKNCNLEKNCEDDKDERIEEPEIQCDLMDESSKKDTNESEEKVHKILSTDKIETLNDKGDLDDTIVNEDKVEEFEKWQNWCDEENIGVGIIVDVDKPNNSDTIKLNLSNGEKHDEIKDEDDDLATVPVNDNGNDDEVKCKKITEETVPTSDLTEEKKLEEEINELEELVDDNAMNNKHEKVQENSLYVLDNSSTDAANEILKEVFELAAAEVQQREETNCNIKTLEMDVEMETLENISREIRKSADMPSLDPISVMDIDDDNDITLN